MFRDTSQWPGAYALAATGKYVLGTGSSPSDGTNHTRAALPMVHLLKPETSMTTHYFWAASSEMLERSEKFKQMVFGALDQVFKNEDEPMPIVAAVASRMKERDLLDMSPVLLPMDAAAMRARRTLRKLIDAECAK
jgi:vanillate O-demethylase monooxygenase subunit